MAQSKDFTYGSIYSFTPKFSKKSCNFKRQKKSFELQCLQIVVKLPKNTTPPPPPPITRCSPEIWQKHYRSEKAHQGILKFSTRDLSLITVSNILHMCEMFSSVKKRMIKCESYLLTFYDQVPYLKSRDCCSCVANVLAVKSFKHAAYQLVCLLRPFIFNFYYFLHFRTNISDIKSERRFDDSMSSLSSSKYMVKLIIYIVTKV